LKSSSQAVGGAVRAANAADFFEKHFPLSIFGDDFLATSDQ
jgi:hypothetical protein